MAKGFQKGNQHGAKSKRGPSTIKKEIWEAAGNKMGNLYMKKAMTTLNKMYSEGQHKDFLTYYLKLLEFFAPKMKSVDVKDVTDRNVYIIGNQDDINKLLE